MQELIPWLYRGLSWIFLYASYISVILVVFGLMFNGLPDSIHGTAVVAVVLYVGSLTSRLMAWALEDFVFGSFTEWNNN